MIAAVTGASGHAGGALVRLLLSRGYRVRALVHEDTRALTGLDVELVKGNIVDRSSLAGLVDGAGYVFHLAAIISIVRAGAKRVFGTNVSGTKNVIEACMQRGTGRLVHMSSIHALSPLPRRAVADETRPLLAEGEGLPYDVSKAISEKLVLDAAAEGLDAVILNPTAILGPFDFKPSLSGEMIISILEGRLPALVSGGFNWIDVRDVCEGALLAALHGKSGERYILSGEWHAISGIASMLARVSGCAMPGFVAPMWLARLGAPFAAWFSALSGKRPLYTSGSLSALRSHRFVSSEKAMRELGFRPRPIQETIRDAYEWLVESGYVKPGSAHFGRAL
jgi:dihydroflavonol-4-reductase